ncbi:MAG: hypothetical protein CK551_09170 [Planctomycetaceae bacterium]|nr:hypothetical protein [Gemmataceae bacterium]PHX62823.1 MAG: hypothetical protein CK551_09170 [Planctomycetaceae bacterium]
MSDSTEKPKGSSGKYSSFPGEPIFTDSIPSDQDDGYKSVSILAILGAVLGGLFVLTLSGGFVAAFLVGTPWIMSPWVIFWPAFSILLSFFAYSRIRASDNTMGGEKLSLWSMQITAIFILCYLANFAGTYFAVRNQADTFVKQWLGVIAKGEVDKAFLLTLKPPRPSEDSNLRTTFEITYNITADPLAKGAYSAFKAKDYVRLIQFAGDTSTKFSLKSASSPVYEMGGYLVRLVYQIDLPDGIMEVAVTALGQESPTGGFKGRQWQVIVDGSGMTQKLKTNDESRKNFELSVSAMEFASSWCMAVANKVWEPAVYGIAELKDRQQILKGFVPTIPLELGVVGGALLQAAESPERQAFLATSQQLFDGKFVRVGENFWSDPIMKVGILDLLAKAFRPMTDHTPTMQISGGGAWIRVENGTVPRYRNEAGKIEFEFDCLMLLFPKYLVQAAFVVTGEEKADEDTPPDWKVKEIVLYRGVSMPVAAPKPGGR